MPGVTKYESIISVSTENTQDVEKLVQTFEKLAGAIEGAGKKADKVAEHGGFEAFAEKIKSGIENPLHAAAGGAEHLLQSMGPMGAAVTAGAGIFTTFSAAGFEATKSLGEFGTEIHNVSVRTGLTTKEVGQFSFAAKLAGTDISAFETAMRKLSQGLDETSEAGKKSRDALHRLGIEYRDNTGAARPMSDVFVQISEGLAAIHEPAKQGSTAMALFGRSGIELLPVMLNLNENFKHAKELGLGASEEDVARWERYHEKATEVEIVMARLARTVKEPLAATFLFLFKDGSGKQYSLEELEKRGVSLGGFRPRSQYEVNQAAKEAGFGAGAEFQRVNTIDDVLNRVGQIEERKRTDDYIRAIAAGQDLHGRLRAAEGELQGMQAPTLGATSMADAEKYQAALKRVEVLRAEVEEVKKLEAAEKHAAEEREGFLRHLASLEESVYEAGLSKHGAIMARRDAEIDRAEKLKFAEEALLDIRTRANVMADSRVQEALRKADERAEEAFGKTQLEASQAIQKQMTETAAEGQRQFDRIAEVEKELQKIDIESERRDVQRRSTRVTRLAELGATGPLGEVNAIGVGYRQRLELAAQMYDFELKTAALITDEGERRIALANAEKFLRGEIRDADLEHELKIGQLQRRRIDELRNLGGQFFDALSQGRQGLEQFFSGLAKSWARTVFENLAVELLKSQAGHLTLPGQGSVEHPTFLGRALAGTPFGLDPLAGATQANTLATVENTLALRAIAAMGSGVSAGGFSSAAGTFAGLSSGEGLGEGHGLPTDGHPGDWGGEYSGGASGGMSLRRALGIGGAAAAGGFGIYSGVRSGGARGALTAAGSAMGAAGVIIGQLDKALKVLPVVGEIAGLGLGLATLLLPDPKLARDREESSRLADAHYNAPTASNYRVDRYGRSYDSDVSGNLRPVVIVNAIDTKSFIDHAPAIAEALAVELEARRSPRVSQALRNTVR